MKKQVKKTTKKSPKIVAATKTITMLNARIKELKEKAKEMGLTILEQRGVISANNDTLAQQNAVLDALTGQVEAHNRGIQEAINTTAYRMIELDDYNEKVRIAKIAAMNVYGTLTVIQRDLKAVIDTPGPDATTPDVMEALLEGDLHLAVPEPTGEVANMVEGMFNDLGDDAPTAGLGVRFVSDSENTDLGLIPDLGEQRAASVFPDNAQFAEIMSAIPNNAPISAMFSSEEAIPGLTMSVLEGTAPAKGFLEPKSPTSAHLKTRPSYDPKRDLDHIAKNDDRIAPVERQK